MPKKKVNKKTLQRAKKMQELLNSCRAKSHMTQEELAQKSKVSIDVIRAISRGVIKTPNIFIFLDLTKALKIEWKNIKNL